MRLIVVVPLVLSLSVNFLTWEKRAYAFSVGEERELGEKLLAVVRKEFKLLNDPDITQYINGLGREILTIAGPQYFNYHFFVINNKEFNAFAAPSGLIFIHSGLIEITDREGELVGVMAHEVGHVTSRHIADRISKSSKINIGTAAMLIAGIALGGGALGQALVTGSMAAGASMNLKFSRQDEEEADRLAYKWMKAEGRDPADMVAMLRKMRKVSRYHRGALPPYLLTHPEPERRMNYIEDLLYMEHGEKYAPRDQFNFRRIKYRLLTLTKDPAILLPIFLREAGEVKTPERANVMVYFGLSKVYLMKGAFEEAKKALQTVIDVYPDKPMLTTDMGIIYFEAGDFKKALELFTAASEAEPDNSYTMFYLARALQQTGSLARALHIYEKLLEQQPDYARSYYQISQIKAAQGDQASGFYYLGYYHWLEGDDKMAKQYLMRAVQSLPTHHVLQQKAKELLNKIEKIEKS